MKTAVEILVEQLIPKAFATYDVTTFNAIEQSKQIEKEQIMNAWKSGNKYLPYENPNEYYNQTYNQNES
jgi:hypothetical protein